MLCIYINDLRCITQEIRSNKNKDLREFFITFSGAENIPYCPGYTTVMRDQDDADRVRGRPIVPQLVDKTGMGAVDPTSRRKVLEAGLFGNLEQFTICSYVF